MATEIKNCDLNNNEINDAYDQNANELEEGHYGDEEANSEDEDDSFFERKNCPIIDQSEKESHS